MNASFGIHCDFISRSALVLEVARAAFGGSSKQKLVAKHSFESEFVSLSDESDMVIWVRE